MSSGFDTYFGIVDEVTYGTPVAVTRFYEYVEGSEGIEGKYERIESESFRAGQRTVHKDRFQPNPKGAEGDVELEVLDKSFGLLFKHMFGAVSTSGTGPYTHSFTVGDLAGQSFTAQVGRVQNDGTLIPFTYGGGKIDEWELSNEVDGILIVKPKFDFASEHAGAGAGALAAQTPVYVTGAQLFTFAGGVVQIGGADFGVSKVNVKAKNGLKTDRYFMRTAGQTVKREPIESEMRSYEFELTGEFESLAHYQRIAAATASGTLANISMVWTSPAGSSVTVTVPYGRFDEGPVAASIEVAEHSMKGMCLSGDTGSPITLDYVTADATP